ncbi:MAG: hypothetical protein ABWW66_02045 [Archaeoglobaceae archaeon]
MERPLGVTVLAVLFAAVSVLLFVSAIVVGFVASQLTEQLLPPEFAEYYPAMELFLRLFVVFAVVAGLLALLAAYGLLRGKKWGWWLAIVLVVLSVVEDVFFLPYGIVGIIVAVVVIYYLTRPHVRSYFV